MIYFISITLISVSLGIAFGLLARKRKKNANYCPHYYYGCYCPMCRNSIDKEWKNKFEEWKKISNKPEIEINANGKFWKNKEGKSHREDGPACEYANGDKYWYLNGKLHREDGPAVEHANEAKFWYLNDKLHREDGPAIEWSDGAKFWYKEGKSHREDGPACEYANGDKYWYLNGKRYNEEEWKKELNKHQKPVLNKPPTFKSEEEPIKSPEEPKSAELITHNLNWYVRKSINGKTHYLTNTGQWKLYKDYQNYLHLYPELTFLYKFQAQEMLAKITKKEIAKNKIPKLNEVIVKFKDKKVSNLEEIFGKIDFENTNQISKTVFVNPDDAIDYGTYSHYGLMELTISKNCHTNEAIYYRFSPLPHNRSAYTRHKANNFYEAFC